MDRKSGYESEANDDDVIGSRHNKQASNSLCEYYRFMKGESKSRPRVVGLEKVGRKIA